jgi:hypothetical protein
VPAREDLAFDAYAVVFQLGETTMVGVYVWLEQRTWADWLGFGVAVVIALTPWLVAMPENEAVVLSTALVGVSIWGCP